MRGKRSVRISHSMKVIGLLAIVLPVAAALSDDKPAPKPAATTTSKPATAPAKSKEARRAEDIARVLEFFKVVQPEAYDKALKLRETDPAKFEQLVVPAIPTVNNLEEIKRNNLALYELKVEDYRLTYQREDKVKQLHRSDLAASEHDRLLVDLTSIVTRQFEVGQLIRQQEIADIEKRLQKLRAQLEEADKDKDSVIKNRLERLIK